VRHAQNAGGCRRSGPLDCSGPNPDLMLVWWRSEPDPDSSLGPGDCVGLHQLLDAVLPEDPGEHQLRDGRVSNSDHGCSQKAGSYSGRFCPSSIPFRSKRLHLRCAGSSVTDNPQRRASMRKLTPVSSALAALMIVSVLAGCGGGGGIACE
jgi:hypothetical protein